MSKKTGFIEELKRRNVVRVGVVYLIVAWLLAQIADLMLESFESPAWVIKAILVCLIITFPIALILAWAFEITPEGIKKEKDVDRSQSITKSTGRKLDFVIIGVLLVAVSFLLFDRFSAPSESTANPMDMSSQSALNTSSQSAQRTGTSNSPSEPQTKAKSIAVLPFVNMSDDASNEYFSDGISEEILNALARIRELKVAGRTSSFAFKGANQDLRQIGEMLGVEHILEGSVRKAGNKVRITAQLIQVEDGFHLWSDTYDRELTDIFAIQDEIATSILTQLKAQLLGGDGETQNLASQTTNSEVYDLYLLARQRIYARNNASIESATALLDKAIALDPDYAPAYALRGIAAALLSVQAYGDMPRGQAHTQARLYLDKALDLDPGLAEAWAGLGLVHVNVPGEHEQAIETLNKALSINPNLIDASNWLSIAFQNAGRNAEVLAVLEGMVEHDPLYPPGMTNMVNEWNRIGQQDKSFALIEKVRPFMGEDSLLQRSEAITYISQGQWAKSIPLLEEAYRQQPGDSIYRLTLSRSLIATHQYERVLALDEPFFKIPALQMLGRIEEASILADKEAAKGNIETLFNLLVTTGRDEELIHFLEQRWADLDSFEAEYPHGRFGYNLMLDVASAYRASGSKDRFDEAMSRVRAAHDKLTVENVQGAVFKLNEANYHALAADYPAAKEFLATSIDAGFITALPISRLFVAFSDLEGDPEYEAIQTRMMENLNTQRATLGLEPAAI